MCPQAVQNRDMRRQLLLPGEIHRLDETYSQAYALMIEWRRREPLAAEIHLPKLPERLSVSIGAVVAPEPIGEELVLGSNGHDLQSGRGCGVAVKGTGPSRWIRITDVDRTARWLLWVDYTERIRCGRAVEVLAIDVHRLLRTAPGELTRSQLAKLIRTVPTAWYDPGRARCLQAHEIQGGP
jgi:hypothetical protein